MIRDRVTRPSIRQFASDLIVRVAVGNDTLREVVVDHCWGANDA